MRKTAARFSGYSGFTDSMPQQPTQAQVRQLASKLKTYVNSTKFLKPGSQINVYDKKLKQGIKLPVTNVSYITVPGQKGISHQQFKDLAMRGIIANDPQLLRQAAAYKYVSGVTGKNAQQLKQQQQQKIQDKEKASQKRKALLGWLLGGIGAASGAALPYVVQELQGRKHTSQTYADAAKTGAGGAVAGVGLAALLNSMRDMKA